MYFFRLPRLLRFVVFEILGKALMMRISPANYESRLGKRMKVSYLDHSSSSSAPPSHQDCCLCQSLTQLASDSSRLDMVMCLSMMHCGLGRLSHQVTRALEAHQQRQEDEEVRQEIKVEWQLCALIIDRFLLWIFIMATITATFSILYMSPHTQLFTF